MIRTAIYAEFIYSNGLFGDKTVVEIPSRDIDNIVFERECIAFNIFEVIHLSQIFNGELINFASDRRNIKEYQIGVVRNRDKIISYYGKDSDEYKAMVKGNLDYVLETADQVLRTHQTNKQIVDPDEIHYTPKEKDEKTLF